MIAERQRIASKYRSEGDGKSAEIRGQKEKELKRIQSEAYRKAQEIMGKADAEATRIYAQAYNLDPELYQFLKTMESVSDKLGQGHVAGPLDRQRVFEIPEKLGEIGPG